LVSQSVFEKSTEICVIKRFTNGNGTRQGGILSPYFFTRYIRELIFEISNCYVGCNIGGIFCNILAYADEIVLLASRWGALQYLINLLNSCAVDIDILCHNVAKTVCMVFQPSCKSKCIASEFPAFLLNGNVLQFVNEFRYLGHVINNNFSDNDDIKREIRNLFIRSRPNILIRRFGKCSVNVKLVLFRAYCLCMCFSSLTSCEARRIFFFITRLHGV